MTTRTIWMMAGPMITSIKAGKMQKISGNSNFNGILDEMQKMFAS